MRIPIVTKVVLLALLVSTTARATTFSTPVTGIAVDPAGEFVQGSFDFGMYFATIENVSVELITLNGFDPGFCTGSVCSSNVLTVNLYDSNELPHFDHYVPSIPPGPYPSLYGTFSYLLPGRPSRTYISPLNPYSGLGTPPFPPQWPSFLFQGKGSIGLQHVTHWGCHLNCTGSGWSARAPEISSARLIVEGSAVPEPSTFLLLCAISARGLCFGARDRYRFSGKACDDGACALHR